METQKLMNGTFRVAGRKVKRQNAKIGNSYRKRAVPLNDWVWARCAYVDTDALTGLVGDLFKLTGCMDAALHDSHARRHSHPPSPNFASRPLAFQTVPFLYSCHSSRGPLWGTHPIVLWR